MWFGVLMVGKITKLRYMPAVDVFLFRCVQIRYPTVHIVIFTGDTDAAPDQILSKARTRLLIVFKTYYRVYFELFFLI